MAVNVFCVAGDAIGAEYGNIGDVRLAPDDRNLINERLASTAGLGGVAEHPVGLLAGVVLIAQIGGGVHQEQATVVAVWAVAGAQNHLGKIVVAEAIVVSVDSRQEIIIGSLALTAHVARPAEAAVAALGHHLQLLSHAGAGEEFPTTEHLAFYRELHVADATFRELHLIAVGVDRIRAEVDVVWVVVRARAAIGVFEFVAHKPKAAGVTVRAAATG